MPRPSIPGTKRVSIALEPEDILRIDKLKAAFGYNARTPIIRMALRYFFSQHTTFMRSQGVSPDLGSEPND